MGGVDIIVVNRRTPDDLAECLRSILDHPPARAHTVTICNVEPQVVDISVAEAQMWGRSHWHHLTWQENIGYNRACNLAYAKTSMPLVAWMNADVVLADGVIDTLCDAVEGEPTWGVIGPRQASADGHMTAAGIFGTARKPVHRGWKDADYGQYDDVRDDAIYVAGSLVVMRRAVADELTDCPLYAAAALYELGPWGAFSHYYGDSWLSAHARAHGYKCVYYGAASCTHKWHRAMAMGGFTEASMANDRERFRNYCKAHGVEHE